MIQEIHYIADMLVSSGGLLDLCYVFMSGAKNERVLETRDICNLRKLVQERSDNEMNDIIQPIKLVIWDLDDTLWGGTLDEGSMQINHSHFDIVKNLAERGILSSICSKNDYSKAEHVLREHGIWDYFIFPCIAWKPKGEMVSQILKSAQLLSEQALFIDDQLHNLKEALYYNPNIQCCLPADISKMLAHPSFQGKPDSGLTRLQHYKILEARHDAKERSSSNEQFLFESAIKVKTIDAVVEYTDRIHEMIHRTNQLNFTKKRIDKEELLQLLHDPEVQTGCVEVSDQFGDYGIVGFYAIRNNTLEHFLFSCRIMNMGIEQWTFALLQCPALPQIHEASALLVDSSKPAWINQTLRTQPTHTFHREAAPTAIKCILRGGCDLWSISHYLSCYNIPISIKTVFSDLNSHLLSRNDHLETIYQSFAASPEEQRFIINSVPFYDEHQFDISDLFSEEYNVAIYSVPYNYYAAQYSIKGAPGAIIVPGYDFNLPFMDNRYAIADKEEQVRLKWAEEHLDYVGFLSPLKFKERLTALRNRLPKTTDLIVINGSTVDFSDELQKDRYKHNIVMNQVLESFVAETPSTHLIDVNRCIHSIDDHTDTIYHFKNHIYKKIADEIIQLLEHVFFRKVTADLKKQRTMQLKSIMNTNID